MDINDLKQITEARIKSASVLMGAQDWFFAAYTMATALETALKAMICKTLNLHTYPESPEKPKIVNFFWTHEFEQLKILTGLTEITPLSQTSEIFQNWSAFTQEFAGNWQDIKYDIDRQRQFNKTKTERLYKNLMDENFGVIKTIKEKW